MLKWVGEILVEWPGRLVSYPYFFFQVGRSFLGDGDQDSVIFATSTPNTPWAEGQGPGA